MNQPSTTAVRPGLLNESRALLRTTADDRGLVARPVLTPHLTARPIGSETVLLVSDTFSASLYGALYVRLSAVLDGSLTHDEIVDRLSGDFAPLKIKTALVTMASKGYLVSGEYAFDRAQAAFWSSLGASPRYVETRLASSPVCVAGDDDPAGMAAAMAELGVRTIDTSAEASVLVVPTRDYLDPQYREKFDDELREREALIAQR